MRRQGYLPTAYSGDDNHMTSASYDASGRAPRNKRVAQYPVYPGPPGFPPSLSYPPPPPPPGVSSYQGPELIHGTVDPVTMARPPVPPVAPPDTPHFRIYIGKIAPTVDSEFVLSLLQVCGVVKSWEPVTNPVDVTRTGFGFCEFESAEDSLRAMCLLNKLSVDGQELVLNVNQATRDYFQNYGESTSEGKAKEAETETRDGVVSLVDNGNDLSRAIPDVTARGAVGGQMSTKGETKRCQNDTEEYSDADKVARQRIRSMIEERMKSKLPGSQTPAVQVSACIVDEIVNDDARSSALEEGEIRTQCEKEEHLGEMKAVGSEGQKGREVTAAGKSSLPIDEAPSMDVHMERAPTVVHERSQQRERDGFRKSNDEEKGRQRKYVGSKGQKDREVTAAGKSSLRIDEASSMLVPMECESTVDHERRNQHRERDGFRKSNGEEKGRERKAVGSEGQKDREETAAAKSSLRIDEVSSMLVSMECESTAEHKRRNQPRERHGFRKSNGEEKGRERKALGLEGQKDRVVTAAGKSSLQIDEAPLKCESTVEHRRKSQGRERDGFTERNGEEKGISDKQNTSGGEGVGFELQDTSKSGDNKTLDAKQLLATVPKTKEELFAHDINWAIYDEYGLHERMRPWISKKATEYFGEELAEFVDYVVESIKEHVAAPKMLELLEFLLDDEAENFVLLTWRKLIFEIKKVKEGLD
ncbi:unnamed protein product [Alopecurus aequalis]